MAQRSPANASLISPASTAMSADSSSALGEAALTGMLAWVVPDVTTIRVGGPRWAGEPFYGRVRACPGKAGGPTAGGAELPSRATGQGPADLTVVG
jgi:hypothetical protein